MQKKKNRKDKVSEQYKKQKNKQDDNQEACSQLEEAGEGVSALAKISTKGCSQVAEDSETM